MKKFTLNIGLNVGQSEPTQQIDTTLHNLTGLFGGITNLKIDTSEYDGMIERTLIVEYETISDLITFKTTFEGLSKKLNQECIAVYSHEDEAGKLFWRPETPPYLDFDVNYFKFI